MAKSSQRKGRRGEIELCHVLNDYGYDVKAGRTVSFGTEPDLYGLPGVHIECKRREQTDISAALRQASADAAKFGDGIPVVFTRGNRQRWRVVMELDSFMELYRRQSQKTADCKGCGR